MADRESPPSSKRWVQTAALAVSVAVASAGAGTAILGAYSGLQAKIQAGDLERAAMRADVAALTVQLGIRVETANNAHREYADGIAACKAEISDLKVRVVRLEPKR